MGSIQQSSHNHFFGWRCISTFAIRSRWFVWGMAILVLQLSGCDSGKNKKVVTVFAAASMTDYLQIIAQEFEKSHEWTVRYSFAASSVLARQIESGAKANLFISANPEWAAHLSKQFPNRPPPKSFLGNAMVLISSEPGRLPTHFSSWSSAGSRIAIGNPEHVPAGKYARNGLRTLGLWDKVVPQMIPTSNVREALQLVVLGECDWGIVYASDAMVARLDGLVLPGDEKIQYQLLMVEERPSGGSEAFSKFLFSSYAKELAIKMGFKDIPSQ